MMPAAGEGDASAATPAWHPAARVGFRFVFAWTALACLPFPLDVVPGADGVLDFAHRPWAALVVGFGHHVLGVARPIPVSVGDTTYGWTQLALETLGAVAAAAVWSALDRRRAHPRLDAALRIYLRYFVAAAMLGYGGGKLFGLQFPAPSLSRLAERFGDSSPQGLLWTFMGASLPYQIFAGAVEVAGGVLLMSRRTTTLGALVVAGAMTNVVMLNFCYDVPVKIFSTQLLATAAFLAAPDLGRLFDLLVRRRAPAPPVDEPPPWPARWSRAMRLLKLVAIALLIFGNVRFIRGGLAMPRPSSAIAGIWRVDEARGVDWQELVIGYYRTTPIVRARRGDGVDERLRGELDEGKHTLTLHGDGGARVLSWSRDGDRLALDGAGLSLRLRRVAEPTWLLPTRGFHFVSEVPFNR